MGFGLSNDIKAVENTIDRIDRAIKSSSEATASKKTKHPKEKERLDRKLQAEVNMAQIQAMLQKIKSVDHLINMLVPTA